MTFSLTVADHKPFAGDLTVAPVLPALWMQREDAEVFGGIRACAPCPAVFVFNDTRVDLTQQWQYYIRAINYAMPVEKVAAILGKAKAFCNGTGFGDPADPRANFLLNESITSPLPQFDKTRTCARSVVTGTPIFSLMQAFKLFRKSFAALRKSFAEPNMLAVRVLNGNYPPLLKPGRTYPTTISQIDPDDYLYLPETHRHFFFAANIVNTRGEVVPFPNGALYQFTGDGMPYTWLPHVCRFPVNYPLSRLVALPEGSLPPSPYKTL